MAEFKGKAKVFWEVMCPLHGVRRPDSTPTLRSVAIPAPEGNINIKTAGCPLCSKGAKVTDNKEMDNE